MTQTNEQSNSKELKENALEDIQNPTRSLHYYETLKFVQLQVDYETKYNKLNDFVSDLENLREFFLYQYLEYLEAKIKGS